MAIFNKGPIATVSNTTVISEGAKIEGTFAFASMLHLDGEINGAVNSSSSIVIGKSGILKGKAIVDKMVVNGLFEGEIAANHLEILSGGVVNADISVKEISIEIGAKFNGNSSMPDTDIASPQIDFVEE